MSIPIDFLTSKLAKNVCTVSLAIRGILNVLFGGNLLLARLITFKNFAL